MTTTVARQRERNPIAVRGGPIAPSPGQAPPSAASGRRNDSCGRLAAYAAAILPFVLCAPVARADVLGGAPSWTWSAVVASQVATGGDVNGDGYDDLAAGAPTAPLRGELLLWYGGPGGLGAIPDWDDTAFEVDNDSVGESLCIGGDVNGDGFDDLVATDTDYGAGWGQILVYFGSASGPGSGPDWTWMGPQWDADTGFTIDSAGDYDGDGFDDLAVGAPRYKSVPAISNDGGVFVFAGSAGGPAAAPSWSAVGGQADAQLGYHVAHLGDVNADGLDDLGAAAPWWNSAATADAGRAVIWLGGAGGLPGSPSQVIEGIGGNWTLSGTRRGLVAAGDVNADGFDDVAIGAPSFNSGGQGDEGIVYLHLGAAAGVATTPAVTFELNIQSTNLGEKIAGGGDLDGDGFDDLVLAGNSWDGAWQGMGRAWLFLSQGGMPDVASDWDRTGSAGSDYFPHWLDSSGDLNADGYSDLVAADASTAGGSGVHVFYACLDGDGNGLPDDADCSYPPAGDDDDTGDDDTGDDDSGDDDTGDDDTGDDDSGDDDIGDDDIGDDDAGDDDAGDDDAGDDDDCFDCDGDGYDSSVDCNDLSAAVHPGAEEIEDGIDNDCDGQVDGVSGSACADCASSSASDRGSPGGTAWLLAGLAASGAWRRRRAPG